jgi:hypothetical protein
MAGETQKEIGLEIGHVLFIDIVGYSKLLITEQSERLQKLKEIVWGTEQFRQAQAPKPCVNNTRVRKKKQPINWQMKSLK